MVTPKEIAIWMVEKITEKKILYQEAVVYEIKKKFGDEFTYINENGNLAIDKRILKEFRKLTEDKIVWDRSDFCWRFRKASDPKGSRQTE